MIISFFVYDTLSIYSLIRISGDDTVTAIRELIRISSNHVYKSMVFIRSVINFCPGVLLEKLL